MGAQQDMGKKTAKWQAELWSYLAAGDGAYCPIYSNCQNRLSSGWCAIDDRQRFVKLLSKGLEFKHRKYDFVRPMGECRILQLVEMQAHGFVKQAGIRRVPVPAEIVSLVDQQPVEVRVVPLDIYRGGVWRTGAGWVIQLNENDTDVAKRFTLFHEAFHILARSKGIPAFRRKGGEDPLFHEMLCDHFAGCVLMPAEWVKEQWAKVNDLDQMARTFGVSDTAVFVRLRLMGLV